FAGHSDVLQRGRGAFASKVGRVQVEPEGVGGAGASQSPQLQDRATVCHRKIADIIVEQAGCGVECSGEWKDLRALREGLVPPTIEGSKLNARNRVGADALANVAL